MNEHRADEHRGEPENGPSLYEELFEQSVDGILLIENDRILHANRALCGQLGYVLDELIGSNPIDLIHPADRPEAQTRLGALARGEAVKSPQLYRTLHRDGSALWMEATSRRITWEGRQVTQTIVRDISTRQQF